MAASARASRIKAALETALFLFGLLALGMLYGHFGSQRRWFPFPQLDRGMQTLGHMRDRLTGNLDSYLVTTNETERARTFQPAAVSPGLTLVLGIDPDQKLAAALIGADGKPRHHWDLDWFRIWPEARHVPADTLPREAPGTDIQGYVLSANGDLTFNYDYLGLVQVDLCGKVKWRLPYATHHSVWQDEAGNFRVLGQRFHDRPDPALPNYQPRFREDMILTVSPDGRLLGETSIPALLRKLGLQGLLYPVSGSSTAVHGDPLHTNDLKVFPRSLRSGVLQPGDVMLSLRDLNTILILTPDLTGVKRVIAGPFLRQHDPDFIDGDTISIFDNNNVGLAWPQGSNRVIDYSLRDGSTHVRFAGSRQMPFYTAEMGEHQLLPGGNMLLVEQERGRLLEVDAAGRPVWQYVNIVRPGVAATIGGAQRIAPALLDETRLAALKRACS